MSRKSSFIPPPPRIARKRLLVGVLRGYDMNADDWQASATGAILHAAMETGSAALSPLQLGSTITVVSAVAFGERALSEMFATAADTFASAAELLGPTTESLVSAAKTFTSVVGTPAAASATDKLVSAAETFASVTKVFASASGAMASVADTVCADDENDNDDDSNRQSNLCTLVCVVRVLGPPVISWLDIDMRPSTSPDTHTPARPPMTRCELRRMSALASKILSRLVDTADVDNTVATMHAPAAASPPQAQAQASDICNSFAVDIDGHITPRCAHMFGGHVSDDCRKHKTALATFAAVAASTDCCIVCRDLWRSATVLLDPDEARRERRRLRTPTLSFRDSLRVAIATMPTAAIKPVASPAPMQARRIPKPPLASKLVRTVAADPVPIDPCTAQPSSPAHVPWAGPRCSRRDCPSTDRNMAGARRPVFVECSAGCRAAFHRSCWRALDMILAPDCVCLTPDCWGTVVRVLSHSGTLDKADSARDVKQLRVEWEHVSLPSGQRPRPDGDPTTAKSNPLSARSTVAFFEHAPRIGSARNNETTRWGHDDIPAGKPLVLADSCSDGMDNSQVDGIPTDDAQRRYEDSSDVTPCDTMPNSPPSGGMLYRKQHDHETPTRSRKPPRVRKQKRQRSKARAAQLWNAALFFDTPQAARDNHTVDDHTPSAPAISLMQPSPADADFYPDDSPWPAFGMQTETEAADEAMPPCLLSSSVRTTTRLNPFAPPFRPSRTPPLALAAPVFIPTHPTVPEFLHGSGCVP